MKVENFKDLIIWQKAMELVRLSYEIVALLPSYEKYSLSDQIRRSAVSVPSNIAEGYERKSTKEYVRFLQIANGSRGELMTQIEICKMLGYIEDTSEIEQLSTELGKMIYTIIGKLENKQ